MKKRWKFYLLSIVSYLKLGLRKKIPSRHQVLTELRRKLSPDFSYQSIRTQFYNQLPPYTANCQAAVTYIEMDQDTNVEQTVLHPTKR